MEARGAGWCYCKVDLYRLWKDAEIREGPWLEEEQFCCHLQRKESFSIWSLWKWFWNPFLSTERRSRWLCHYGFTKSESYRTNQIVFCEKMPRVVDKRRLAISFALTLAKYKLDGLAQKVLANESYSIRRPVTAGVLLESILGLPCLISLKKDMEEVMACLLIKFSDDIRLGRDQKMCTSTWLPSRGS